MVDDGTPRSRPDASGRDGAAHALPASMLWPRRLGLLTIGLALVFVLSAWARHWLIDPVPEQALDVAHQWHATINRLGIEPIYPPTEDVSVGDIILAVTEDRLEGRLSPSIQGRAVKLWHVDVSEALEDNYKGLHLFPETLPRPKQVDEIWAQQASQGPLFKKASERRNLPIVLFPGVTVARVRGGSIGAGWTFNPFGLFGAAEGEAEQTIDLRIPSAESYGLPNATATYFLDRFCKAEQTRFWCTEAGARGQLSMVMGRSIHSRIASPEHPLNGQFRYGAEVLFVARVYLTRSIESVTESRSAMGAQAKLAARLAQEVQRSEAAGAATPTGPSTTDPPEVVASRRALADLQTRLTSLVSELSGTAPGGAVSVRAADQTRIAVTQNLQRPVVIGIRAARRELFER